MKRNIIYGIIISIIFFSYSDASVVEQNTGSENFNATSGIFYDKSGFDYIFYHPELFFDEGVIFNYNINGLIETGFSLLSPPDIDQSKLNTSSRLIFSKKSTPIKVGLSYYFDKTTDPYTYNTSISYGTVNLTEQFTDGSKNITEKNYDGTEKNCISVLQAGIGIPLGSLKWGVSYQNRLSYFVKGSKDYEYAYNEKISQISAAGVAGYQEETDIAYKNQPREKENIIITSFGFNVSKGLEMTLRGLVSIKKINQTVSLDKTYTINNSPASGSVINKDVIIGSTTNVVEPVNFEYASHPYILALSDPEIVEVDEPMNKYGGTLSAGFRLTEDIKMNVGGAFFVGSGTIKNAYQDYAKKTESRPNIGSTLTETRISEILMAYTEDGDNDYISYGSRIKITYKMAAVAKIGFAFDWKQEKEEKVIATTSDYKKQISISDASASVYTSDNWGAERNEVTTENLKVEITDTTYTRTISLPIGVEISVMRELVLLLGAKPTLIYSAQRLKFETTADAVKKKSIDYSDPALVDQPSTAIANTSDKKYVSDIYSSTGSTALLNYQLGFQVYPSEKIRLDFMWDNSDQYSLSGSYKF